MKYIVIEWIAWVGFNKGGGSSIETIYEEYLIIKEENKSRLCDYKQGIRHRALQRFHSLCRLPIGKNNNNRGWIIMARFGKTIKIVENILRKAELKGIGTINRMGEEVYSAEIVEQRNNVTGNVVQRDLYFHHYGTLTLVLDLTENKIKHHYGFSNSDRDSLNTVLDYFGIEDNKYFRIQKGEFLLEDRSKELVSV